MGDLMVELREAEGFLPFDDKSDPEEIRRRFGMSKKVFKKVVGNLYKEGKVEFRDGGIGLR